MYKVLVIINAQQVSHQGTVLSTSPATQRMISTFKDAITHESEEENIIKVVASHQLLPESNWYQPSDASWLYCPLTIELPPQFDFPAAKLFQACRDIKGTRQWVKKKFNTLTGNQINKNWHGNYWLPIIYTAKGPMYGEVIGEGELPNSYQQPIDFPDQIRKPLYYLGYELLEALQAQPSVYLLQFGLQEEELVFDRIWPFPAAPALASVGIQEPNLYICHWQCLTKQPIRDLVIA